MKQYKHKSGKFLLGLSLLLVLNQTVLAQFAGNLWGQMTIGDPVSLINGDLVIKPSGELFLGSHSPRGLQTNMLSITGNYIGEDGSRIYTSVIDNSNLPNTHGYIDIVGTAAHVGGATLIVIDFFNASAGWDGSCIDLIRANSTGSDVGSFRIDEMQLNNRTAVLRHRIYGNSVIWFLAEKLIKDQNLIAQSVCLNESFEPLSVVTDQGNYAYQWYRCDSDGSNLVNLGFSNGARTPDYTPVATTPGTSYYRCVVTSLACSYNTDTTAVSGAVSVGMPMRIVTQPATQVLPNDGSVTGITLNVVADGGNLAYQWYKNGEIIMGETNADLNISLSEGSVSEYYVEVSGCGGTIRSTTATVGYCLPIIVQKRNHTLIVNNNPKPLIDGGNGGYEFVYYTWYKNNRLLKSEAGGAAGSFDKGGYYYTGGGNLNLSDEYYVILHDANNNEYQTCPYTPVNQVLAKVNTYPNPVSSADNYTVTVDAKGKDDSVPSDGMIYIYNAHGVFLGRKNVAGRFTQVKMPRVSGTYFLMFKSNEISEEFKIIVK